MRDSRFGSFFAACAVLVACSSTGTGGGSTHSTGGSSASAGGSSASAGGSSASAGGSSASSSSGGGGSLPDAGGDADASGAMDAADGACTDGGAPYPTGPHGLGTGDTVPDLQLTGFADPAQGTSALQTFALDDFYNPTGTEVFPACSPFAPGSAKPKALVIVLAALWNGPSNDEAMNVLPALHAKYAAAGGQFVTILVESNNPGMSATEAEVVNWSKKYNVDYPSGIESTNTLLGTIGAYPQNLVVDTRTMQIVATAGEVEPTSCGAGYPCATDADCQVCQGSCSDGSNIFCQTSSDCASGVTCGPTQCGDGTACSAATQCAAKTCSTSPFWATYQALLGFDGG